MKYKRLTAGLLAFAMTLGGYAFSPSKFTLRSDVAIAIDDAHYYDERDGYCGCYAKYSDGWYFTGFRSSPTASYELSSYEKKKITSYSLVSTINNEPLTNIGKSSFRECSSLKSIIIPETVNTIGEGAFYHCSSLSNIVIPNSVTKIRSDAFDRCIKLDSVSIPDTVAEIENYAFYGCSSLTNINLPNTIKSIEGYTFYGCSSLESIIIPESVTSIGERCFDSCSSLMNITIPNGITNISDLAFYSCTALKNVNIPESVTEISINAFRGCTSLTTVIIPASVTAIGKTAIGYSAGGNLIENCIIYGEKDSVAETYANENNITFKLMSEVPTSTTEPEQPAETLEISVSSLVELNKALKTKKGAPLKYDLNGDNVMNIIDLALLKQKLLNQ